MKILKPLFLDELYAEFAKVKSNRNRLLAFHDKLASLRFLDPACGCGNFLILAYRELRLLEIEVLKALHPAGQLELDVHRLSRIDVDAFYGIEIEEFPARIAEVALWLMDHQMNMRLSDAFGVYYVRLPLCKSAHIVHGNALRMDWREIVPPARLSYILGNPPFVGSKFQIARQREEMQETFAGVKGAGVLDYVAAWYIKAAQYIQGTKIRCAFVSTNSISQGEQVGILWQELFSRYHLKIHFAHKTFAWGSEARGKANVHVIIIGFAAFDSDAKLLYDYDTPKAEPHETVVSNVNPYLIEGGDFVLLKRSNPICNVPIMQFGNMPIDDGNFILDEVEKTALINAFPQASAFIKSYIGSYELINNVRRSCIWLSGAPPDNYRMIPEVMSRIQKIRKFREDSKRPVTRDLAKTPSIFGFISHEEKPYIAIPRVSSESRFYLPMMFLGCETIPSDQISVIYNATLYHFGVLNSLMHMEWMRYVCGRLKSDYRYSGTLVYNNFPWPQNPTSAQVKSIETKAQAVLDARAQFPDSSLAALYDPLTMPPVLLKAHQALDKAVDTSYRKQSFDSERHRIEFLFALYQQITAPLVVTTKKKGRKA